MKHDLMSEYICMDIGYLSMDVKYLFVGSLSRLVPFASRAIMLLWKQLFY